MKKRSDEPFSKWIRRLCRQRVKELFPNGMAHGHQKKLYVNSRWMDREAETPVYIFMQLRLFFTQVTQGRYNRHTDSGIHQLQSIWFALGCHWQPVSLWLSYRQTDIKTDIHTERRKDKSTDTQTATQTRINLVCSFILLSVSNILSDRQTGRQ